MSKTATAREVIADAIMKGTEDGARDIEDNCSRLMADTARDFVIKALDAAGFVIVPKEATKETVSRSRLTWTGGEPYTGPSVSEILEIYRAMIAAAQEPQS